MFRASDSCPVLPAFKVDKSFPSVCRRTPLPSRYTFGPVNSKSLTYLRFPGSLRSLYGPLSRLTSVCSAEGYHIPLSGSCLEQIRGFLVAFIDSLFYSLAVADTECAHWMMDWTNRPHENRVFWNLKALGRTEIWPAEATGGSF